ncbi:hypothetical protein PoB_000459500 [Plakobranchus ocellatus]|uniref:Uncharacterized protein n=1 Tax=Plakobranchus ocellatus TaxID=259542 RepID=A0AAV3Y5K0_9GAST|nr:hypothetical protein PoB_000459500 [Plakobranchus ocellatus]
MTAHLGAAQGDTMATVRRTRPSPPGQLRLSGHVRVTSGVAKNLSDGKKEESQQLEEYREKTNSEGTSSGSPGRHHGYCRESKALSVWATSPQWE